MSEPNSQSWARLRELPIAARICLACFLVSIGVGYFSALVQMHFQHADPGDLLPKSSRVVRTFHGLRPGEEPRSRLETLITADENLPWNGSGQMSAAFTTKSTEPKSWTTAKREKARELNKGLRDNPTEKQLAEAEVALREERQGEIATVVAWIRLGAAKDEYDADKFCLPPNLAISKLTPDFEHEPEHGTRYARIKSIFDARCARCHSPTGDPKVAHVPLDNYAAITKLTRVETGAAMSIEKLAQTTHVHLLAFSMLYMLTGVLLAMTSYPNLIKIPLACTPLLVQLFDISCWWLARIPGEPGVRFAELIPITGAIVGLGLGLQILLTLFDLFGKWGKLVLVLLIAGAGVGGSVVAYKVIAPHMEAEKAAAAEKK